MVLQKCRFPVPRPAGLWDQLCQPQLLLQGFIELHIELLPFRPHCPGLSLEPVDPSVMGQAEGAARSSAPLRWQAGPLLRDITWLAPLEHSAPQTRVCPVLGVGRQRDRQPGSHIPISHVHNYLQNRNLNLLLILPNSSRLPVSPCSIRRSLFQHKYRFFWKCDLFLLILISSCILQFKKHNP